MNPKKRFLYTCGGFLFSVLIVAIISFFPLTRELYITLTIGIIAVGTISSYIYPKLGYNLTKLFVGWSSHSDPGGVVDPNMANRLATDEFDSVHDVKTKSALIFIFTLILIGIIIWRFPVAI